MLSREGKIPNNYTSFPTFRELSRSEGRLDFLPVLREVSVSTLDFDLKREPVMETARVDHPHGYEMFGFDTRAWDTIAEYESARSIARHMQNNRPGTTGEDRPTGCLRTESDWLTWSRRFRSRNGRRVRTRDAALLTELVAAHKAGVLTVPVLSVRGMTVRDKLAWLSSLGFGEFTKSQWDHMSKKSRRDAVLADADLSVLAELIDDFESVGAA